MTLYYFIRKGTSERIIDHGGNAILVEEEYLREARTRYASVLKAHPEDLEAVSVDEYLRRFEVPVRRAVHLVQQEELAG